jgi:ribosomal-protein-alanine N-acetyltransferase
MCRAGEQPLTSATPPHAEALAAIHAAAYATTHRWDADSFARLLAQPGVYGLIDPAGGMVLARIAADEAEILTLGVAPHARRAGRATAMLRAAEAHAAAAGARTMFLEVAADNAPARALYAASGYRQAGKRRAYYADGTDALVLARSLTCGAAAPA